MIELKSRVIVSVGKLNFPMEVSEVLKSVAEIVYATFTEYDELLYDARAVIVGMEPVDGKYLTKAPNLGLVARFGVGYDSVDVDYCTKRRVYVTHTPDVLSKAVAEHTWALILGLYRKIPMADRFTREEWALQKKRFQFGRDINGKTLGIIGLGRIGSEVAKRAQGFGVELRYYDTIRRPQLERQGIKFVDFDRLLKVSDIVSLHVPLLPTTRGLIGEREFKLMKPSAVLINTSRGHVVDQEALVKALENREIAGVALDVFEKEPINFNNRLLKIKNVLTTPHIASATLETRRKMAVSCADSVRTFLEGHIPVNIVPEQRGVFF